MRYHLKCLFLLTADTSHVQLPHSLVVLDKTPQRTPETRTKTDGAARTQAGTWSKSPSFPPRSSLRADGFGSGERISWESRWDARCQHAPAVSEHPQAARLRRKVGSPDWISVCLSVCCWAPSHVHQTFLGSSVNRKVCCWFFWWLLFSGLHIRPGGVRLDFQKVFLSLPFWVRSFVKLWIPLLHPLSRVNYYSTPPLPSGLWVSMFGWIISHGKKKMLIMPLTPGSSVPSAPFSTLHREVFFSSIFCFEELPNSPLVCCVLIFHSC